MVGSNPTLNSVALLYRIMYSEAHPLNQAGLSPEAEHNQTMEEPSEGWRRMLT